MGVLVAIVIVLLALIGCSGEAPPSFLVGPSWCLDKPAIKRAVEGEFARRGTRQGSRFVAASAG